MRWASLFSLAFPRHSCGPQFPLAGAAGGLIPSEALARGLEGKQPPANTYISLGLGAGKDGLVLFFWGEHKSFMLDVLCIISII